jgi:hypothetical protein
MSQSAARRGSGRIRILAVVGVLALPALVISGLGGSATAAGPLDGVYTGTFSGTASGEVEFSISDVDVTVTKPGSGSGTVDDSDIEMVVGSAVVSGYTCEYTSTGQVSVNAGGEGTAAGTWNATCNQGVTANGTWQATRPPNPSPSPSPSPNLQTRTLTLTAKPTTLSEPGRTRLKATLSGCTTTSTIEFQVRKSGRFQNLQTKDVDEACKASMKRRVTKKTAFRALAPADTQFEGAVSNIVTVKLKDQG